MSRVLVGVKRVVDYAVKVGHTRIIQYPTHKPTIRSSKIIADYTTIFIPDPRQAG